MTLAYIGSNQGTIYLLLMLHVAFLKGLGKIHRSAVTTAHSTKLLGLIFPWKLSIQYRLRQFESLLPESEAQHDIDGPAGMSPKIVVSSGPLIGFADDSPLHWQHRQPANCPFQRLFVDFSDEPGIE